MISAFTFRTLAFAGTFGLGIYGLHDAGLMRAFGVNMVSGEITVEDGDSVIVTKEDGERITIQLHGIDAPDLGTTCLDKRNAAFDCGESARSILARLVDVHYGQGRCEVFKENRFGDKIARCTVNGTDLSEWMVQQGYAWAKPGQGTYWLEMGRARRRNAGYWSGGWREPWVERAENGRLLPDR